MLGRPVSWQGAKGSKKARPLLWTSKRRAWRLARIWMFMLVVLGLTLNLGAYMLLGNKESLFFNHWSQTEPLAQTVAGPMRIPRVIHQTYNSKELPLHLQRMVNTWLAKNPGWEYRLYDDKDCHDFVEQEFPEYLEAFKALPKEVERSDFFRYLVILKYGGVYADVDTECRQPLESFLLPTDTLVVGWEADYEQPEQAFLKHMVRQRQILNWVFAAAPGHPAVREACDRIKRNALMTFSQATNRDTLARTGPGLWTDVILEHAFSRLHSQGESAGRKQSMGVRILPRVSFGVHPKEPHEPGNENHLLVAHKFQGRWKSFQSSPFNLVFGNPWLQPIALLPSLRWRRAREHINHGHGGFKELPYDTFPVSIRWSPPFDILVRHRGKDPGETGLCEDVSAAISGWGSFQAGIGPVAGFSSLDAVIGALGAPSEGNTFVDIGSGLGYFSLAAARRGYRVFAVEPNTPTLELFNKSIHLNGLEHIVTSLPLAMGPTWEPQFCSTIRAHGPGPLLSLEETSCGAEKHQASHALGRRSPMERHSRASEGQSEGAQISASGDGACEGALPFDEALPESLSQVGAVRIGTGGWEGWVLESARAVLANQRPLAILVEMRPNAIDASGYPGGARGVLDLLFQLGYAEVSHSGAACERRLGMPNSWNPSRWYEVGAVEPVWCSLQQGEERSLLDNAHSKLPESVLAARPGSSTPRPPLERPRR